MTPWAPVDYQTADFGDFYDELPLWSARFGFLLLDQLPLLPTGVILDVGAGTGFLSIELAQRCGPNAHVIAVDPWEAAMARLRRKLDRLGIVNVSLRTQNVVDVELADNSVDLVVSNLGLNNFEDPTTAVRKCYQWAKPGGELWLTTNLVGHMQEFYDEYRQLLTDHGLTNASIALDANIHHRVTVAGVGQLLQDAGFEIVGATTSSFQERFADGAALLRHFFIRLAFVSSWRAIVSADTGSLWAELEQRLNARARHLGELSLTIPAACIQARKPTGK